jgi:uncharacterized protein YjiS (DUF1127 family)
MDDTTETLRELTESVKGELRRLTGGEIDDIHITRTESGRIILKTSTEDRFEMHEASR